MTENNNTTLGELSPGMTFANRFEVQSRIAAGGMGVVYRVKDLTLGGEVVALKLLHPQYSENKVVLKRFLNEVRVARALSHPNIVRIHDFGTAENGQAFITMEYVSGQSLSKLLSSIFPENPEASFKLPARTFADLLQVYRQVLEAISYAHRRGIIHRDLKPANILINNDGEVKVADFGTARILGNTSTITVEGSASLGTPQYMSPEQVRGDELDKACDIYALGILAYELVRGTPPFYGIAPMSIMYKQLHEPIPPFASEARGIPVWWQTLALKATEKNKQDRFVSVDAMLQVIADQTGEARDLVSAPPTIEGFNIHIKNRRSRMVLLLIGATAILTCVLAVQFMQPEQEANRITIPYLPPLQNQSESTSSLEDSDVMNDMMPVETMLPTEVPNESVDNSLSKTPSSSDESSLSSSRSSASATMDDPQLTVKTKEINEQQQNSSERKYSSNSNFQGTFSRATSGDTSAADKSIKLALTISNGVITGQAFIEDARFQVTGKSAAQGMQLTLKSASQLIQLSGVYRNGGYLRGSYYIPLTNSRGTWMVKEQ